MTRRVHHSVEEEEASPELPWPRTWRGVYLVVLGCFIIYVILLTWLARAFA